MFQPHRYKTIVRHRELHFSREQIDLIKENVAKGTSDEQLQLFLYVCKKHRLDPLAKQIYCVLWPREGGKFHDMVIITGINGFRTTAARDHKDFGGTSKAIFVMTDTKTPAGRPIPESCSMVGFKKAASGIYPAGEMEVFWSEFAPANLNEKRAEFWRLKPRHMLQKCCEAQLLRKLYPDLSDVYVEEEVAQRMQDFTPGGREIVLGNGENPSGRVANGQPFDPIRDKAVEEAKAKGLWCERHNCPIRLCPSDEHSAGELEAFAEAEQRAKGQDSVQPLQGERKRAYAGRIEIDWTDKASPRLIGSLGDVLPLIEKHCTARWGDDNFWHILPKDAAFIKKLCQENNFEFVETLPAKSSGSGKATPDNKAKSGGAVSGAKQEPAAPTLVNGTLHRVVMGTTSKNQPYLSIKLNSEWLRSFVNPIFEFLTKGVGQAAELWIDKNHSVVGLKRIGRQVFDEDGRTPVIQRKDQEAGGKTLF